MTDIAFTGTRKGMTPEQRTTVRSTLAGLEAFRAHHGDCIGADEQFNNLVLDVSFKHPHDIELHIHPPIKFGERAYCFYPYKPDWVTIHPAKEFLERDRDMVDASELLIATPSGFTNVMRGSGTWYTIRYADRIGVKAMVVLPDGTIRDQRYR